MHKQERLICGKCVHCDRESYRAVQETVRYKLNRDLKLATTISEKQAACRRFEAVVS
jgi:hypothetical protein